MINLPRMTIRGKETLAIIQGAMGVGISGPNLVTAVLNCGAGATLAAVGLGKVLPGYTGKYELANSLALEGSIKSIMQNRTNDNGILGVNVMYALSDFESLIRTASKLNVDFIAQGAGMCKNLPQLVNNDNVALIPIVSSVRALDLIVRSWGKDVHGGRLPDAVIIEDPLNAGGHLGCKYEDLINNNIPSLEHILENVLDYISEGNFDINIPVIVAGGIYTGTDIKKYIGLGAQGVQMATRFVTTEECDANKNFKDMYLNCKKSDIILIESPVGLPARAIGNKFLSDSKIKSSKISCPFKCLKTCSPQAKYCIADSLINAQKGKLDKGFAFAGSNAYRATPETCLDSNGEYITVKDLFTNLSDEYNSGL